MPEIPFWERKTLSELTDAEWESLCDGCGRCCLHKLINEETADVFYTRVACRLLHPDTGRCSHYANRLSVVEDCVDVRRMSDAEMAWMPKTCAYRLLHEGKPLPTWHPLRSGDPGSVAAAGIAVAGRTIDEATANLDNLEADIIEWVEA